MKRKMLCSLYLMIMPLFLFSQAQNNVWTFGGNYGLNFNTTPPTYFTGNSQSWGASSSVSDAGGNLLFYSNGNNVWDASGTIMPNGSGILGNDAFIDAGGNIINAATVQGVYIVQSPGNKRQYYLFTLEKLLKLQSHYPPRSHALLHHRHVPEWRYRRRHSGTEKHIG